MQKVIAYEWGNDFMFSISRKSSVADLQIYLFLTVLLILDIRTTRLITV